MKWTTWQSNQQRHSDSRFCLIFVSFFILTFPESSEHSQARRVPLPSGHLAARIASQSAKIFRQLSAQIATIAQTSQFFWIIGFWFLKMWFSTVEHSDPTFLSRVSRSAWFLWLNAKHSGVYPCRFEFFAVRNTSQIRFSWLPKNRE